MTSELNLLDYQNTVYVGYKITFYGEVINPRGKWQVL
jgi:hypothetical protein